jgi:hypothetical protein
MKKSFVFSAILVCLLLGLIFIGCDNSSGSESNPEPKTITITGLNGMTGEIAFTVYSGNPNTGTMEPVAVSSNNISNNSVTFSLELPNRTGPWTGSGSFILVLETKEAEYAFTNGQTFTQLGITASTSAAETLTKIPKYDIKSASSTIAFSQFRNSSEVGN